MSFTATELETALEGVQEWSEWCSWVEGYGGGPEEDETLPEHVESWTEDEIVFRNIGTVTGVSTDGDGESYDGDTYMVFKVVDADGYTSHYRKDGQYISHDGTYWEGDFYKVQKRERKITFWE